MIKNKKIGKAYLMYGTMKGFGLGFTISRWQITIDFICLFIIIEF